MAGSSSIEEKLKIEIYSDVICPWCYIGKRRFEKALKASPKEVDIEWMPFQLNPTMPAEGMQRQDYLEQKFGGPEAAEQVYAPVRAAGKQEAIDFAFESMSRTPNTLQAHRLIHFAKQQDCQEAIVQRLFEVYFEDGEDIGDSQVLCRVGESAGLPETSVRDYLKTDQDRDKVTAQDEMARQMGIQGVPFFVIARKYAVSGAQAPEAFAQVFATLDKEAAD